MMTDHGCHNRFLYTSQTKRYLQGDTESPCSSTVTRLLRLPVKLLLWLTEASGSSISHLMASIPSSRKESLRISSAIHTRSYSQVLRLAWDRDELTSVRGQAWAEESPTSFTTEEG
ncbi:hypothetical protein EYF80_008241 [Liparis tanakae]|uniref:Uncharacterized protein n=1 Tax=Liparis tanakae TaxID=230148 RepID=A0A4Z2ITX7_9TELE|nr:hypothetical protein EYF80_008241 [Liparis tanakae]